LKGAAMVMKRFSANKKNKQVNAFCVIYETNKNLLPFTRRMGGSPFSRHIATRPALYKSCVPFNDYIKRINNPCS